MDSQAPTLTVHAVQEGNKVGASFNATTLAMIFDLTGVYIKPGTVVGTSPFHSHTVTILLLQASDLP